MSTDDIHGNEDDQSPEQPDNTENPDEPFSDEQMSDESDGSGETWFSNVSSQSVFDSQEPLSQSYIPSSSSIKHREGQRKKLIQRFSDFIDNDTLPDVLFLNGPNGTGKTLMSQVGTQELQREVGEDRLAVVEVSCANCDTEYQVAAHAANEIYPDTNQIEAAGHAKQKVLQHLFDGLDDEIEQDAVILILDEVGKVDSLNDIMYQVTRSEQSGTRLSETDVCLILTSNRTTTYDNMKDAVYSSLRNKEIIRFDPYDSDELQDILRKRAELSFTDDGIENGVIELAAALAAQNGGDARYGLQILYRAGKIASTTEDAVVTQDTVKEAQRRIDRSRIEGAISDTTDREKLILAVLVANEYEDLGDKDSDGLTGKEIHNIHTEFANRYGLRTYHLPRVYDILSNFTQQDLIEKKSIGRSNAYTLPYSAERYLEAFPTEFRMAMLEPKGRQIDPILDTADLSEPNTID